MITTQLRQLAKTYRRRGMVKPSDLLLETKDALELLDELAKLQVLVLGVDGWTCVNREKGQAVQGLGVGFDVGQHISYDDVTPEESVELTKQYIKERLPPEYDLVSIDLEDPEMMALFIGKGDVG